MTDEHLKALGRVAVNFQALETYITYWGMTLLGQDQVIGQMVTAQLPFGKRCILANSLCEYRFGGATIATDFDALIRKSLELEVRRNQLFHSTWLTDDVSGEISRLKFSLKLGKGLTHATPEITLELICQLADEMKEISKNLGELIGKADEASPDVTSEII